MLNNLNSNVTSKKGQIDAEKVKDSICALKTEINETNNRIDELGQTVATDRVITDSISTDNISGRTADFTGLVNADTITSNGIQTARVESTVVNASDVATNTLNAEIGRFNDVQTGSLTVSDTLQLNGGLNATNVAATSINVSDTVTANTISNTNLDGFSANFNDVGAVCISSDELNADTITAENITTQNIESDNATFNYTASEKADIKSIESDLAEILNAKVNHTDNTETKATGKINIQPNLDLPSQWVTVKIPHVWLNKEWMLSGTWSDTNSTYSWSVSGIGSEQTNIIAWNQSALETIKDFSFDKANGDLYVRVRAEDYIYYHTTYNGEDYTLTAVVSGPGSDTEYVPETLRGYLFQSYNDDTTAFYFGGQVKLYSLKAEIQDFDWATYKNIGVQQQIRFPISYNDDGSVAEWDSGTVGDYITYRETEVNGNTIVVPVWEAPTILLTEDNKERLVKAEAFKTWDGSWEVTSDKTLYPLTELGDTTCVHGSASVKNNLDVSNEFTSCHIYDVDEYYKRETEIPDESLVVTKPVTHSSYYTIVGGTGYKFWQPSGMYVQVDFSDPLFATTSDGFVTVERNDVKLNCYIMNAAWRESTWNAYKDDEIKRAIMDAEPSYFTDPYYVYGCPVSAYGYDSEGNLYIGSYNTIMQTYSWYKARNRMVWCSSGSSPDGLGYERWTFDIDRDPSFTTIGRDPTRWTGHDLACFKLSYQSGSNLPLCLADYVQEDYLRINRKTTCNNDTRLDEVAVYDSAVTNVNGKPVIYNAEDRALRTTDCITIDCGEFEYLNVACDAVIGGDLYVKGTTHTVDEETISTSSDNIVLRQNNDSALPSNQLSGVIVNNYDGDGKVSIIGSDNTGTVRVGTADTTTSTHEEIYLKGGKWYEYNSRTNEYTEITVTGELVGYESKSINEDGYTKYEEAVFAEFSASDTVPILGRQEENDMIGGSLVCWNSSDLTAHSIPIPIKAEQTIESRFDENNKLSYVWTDKKPTIYRFDTVSDYNLFTLSNTIPENSIVEINCENNYICSEDIR